METLYLLIPLSLLLVLLIAVIFLWAIRSGQYDDLEAPRHQILMDDDDTKNRTEVETEGARPRTQNQPVSEVDMEGARPRAPDQPVSAGQSSQHAPGTQSRD